jgi:thiol-disulfide isomerase/thioredoxin
MKLNILIMKLNILIPQPHFFSILFLSAGFSLCGKAQSNDISELVTVRVGKACPPFVLEDVHYYPKQSLSSDDLKGKPVILDFFGSHCSVCFESFPEAGRLQKKFAGQLEWILIGDLDSTIKKVYEKFNKRYQLNLTVAYDSILFKKWQIIMTPYEVWIDEHGIVKAITGPSYLTESNIRSFIDHGVLDFPVLMNNEQLQEDPMAFNYLKPLLINGNAGNDSEFLYRSLLAPWKRDQLIFHAENIMHQFGNTFQAVGISLSAMYEIAYGDTVKFYAPPLIEDGKEPNRYGNWLLKPVLRVKDPSLFFADFNQPKNLYDYSLIGPLKAASAYYLQQAMRRDLKNYFGYDVKVVRRRADYWKLVTTRRWKKMLISKGDSTHETFTHAGFSLQNIPIKELVAIIHSVKPWEIFVDKTGISKNIDLNIDAIMTEFEDVRKALAEKGLFLIRARKKINTIIISDPRTHLQ